MNALFKCLYDELVPIENLKPHPKNQNKHPKEQVERLAKILKYQGWRYPIKISKRSGYITSGHGRIEAARVNKWKQVPVNFQDYESDEQEYADVQADNAIASWAELNLAGINADLGDLGPDFDIDLLGLKNFLLEPADKFIETPLTEELWTDEFEGPKKVFRIVVSVQQENYKKKVLDLLGIKKVKNFNTGTVISVRWPEIENE